MNKFMNILNSFIGVLVVAWGALFSSLVEAETSGKLPFFLTRMNI